jgi:hypothetical protein
VADSGNGSPEAAVARERSAYAAAALESDIMAQSVFNSALNRFCMNWATPIPGNTTVYGGPIRTGSEVAIKQLRSHKEDLFEQLLLFENVNFSVNGPNTIVPLLYRAMGEGVRGLLESKALFLSRFGRHNQ